jgi:CTP:molybdopterin cytidylyltransferase MocA
VAVVLGAESARVAEALDGLTCEQLQNVAWTEGMASSIRIAAAWAEQHELTALLLLVCDQLRITDQHIEQLWHAWTSRPDAAVASAYADTLGIPAIFPRRMYPELLGLQGDRGAAKLLRAAAVTVVPWPDGAYDLDTPEDLERLKSQ